MINKAILMGRLTRDPELRHTGSGTPVCSFSIAIDNGYGETETPTLLTVLPGTKLLNLLRSTLQKAE